MKLPESATQEFIKSVNSVLLTHLGMNTLTSIIGDDFEYYDIGNGHSNTFLINILPEDTGYEFDETPVKLTVVCNKISALGMKTVVNNTINVKVNIHKIISNVADVEKSNFAYVECITTLRHEIIHAMQEIVIGPSGVTRMMETDKNIKDDYERYLTSEIEYDPHVSDMYYLINYRIEEFRRHYSLTNNDEKSIIKYFLAANSTITVFANDDMNQVASDWFKPDDFILVLKERKAEKWKKAIKKITRHYYDWKN